jgi:alkanesulfonate monooxygenase SsuD/methylene tetrahydromethanopterin reductase-like flavin-dependent oxidoreductase (luciferase family)
MLRLTARHADAWNTAWYGAHDDRLRDALRSFDEALALEGRDGSDVARTVGMIVRDPDHGQARDDGEDSSFNGSVDELGEAIGAYEALGIDHLIVLLEPMTEASLDRLSKALASSSRLRSR